MSSTISEAYYSPTPLSYQLTVSPIVPPPGFSNAPQHRPISSISDSSSSDGSSDRCNYSSNQAKSSSVQSDNSTKKHSKSATARSSKSNASTALLPRFGQSKQSSNDQASSTRKYLSEASREGENSGVGNNTSLSPLRIIPCTVSGSSVSYGDGLGDVVDRPTGGEVIVCHVVSTEKIFIQDGSSEHVSILGK